MRCTAIVTLVLSGGILGLAGCTSEPLSVVQATSTAGVKAGMDSVRDALAADRPTITTYRNAVQQVNSYLDASPEEMRGPARSPEEVQRLKALAPGFSDAELRHAMMSPAQVQQVRDLLPASTKDQDAHAILGRSFTILDAYHLDGCFLFHDAAQALRQHRTADPLPLAVEVFAWVMRQVDLQPKITGLTDWPAQDVLRRGTGDAEERLRVFLALLAQLDLEGGVLTRQSVTLDRERNTVRRQHPWLAAVLHQGDLYLFDPVAGEPVWKDKARGEIATWSDLKAQPALREKYLQGRTDPAYSKELLEGNELWLEVSLTALAPRMLWLQEQLSRDLESGEIPVRLHQNWSARLQKFDAGKAGLRVKNWAREDRPAYPIRVLAEYVDQVQRIELGELAVLRPADVVTPWDRLPAWLRDDRQRSGLYYQLMSPRAKQLLAQGERPPENDMQRRLMAPYQSLFVGIRLAPGGHRDLLVRGKAERVVQRILKTKDEIDRALHQLHTEMDPEPDLRDRWGPILAQTELEFVRLQAEYLRLRQESVQGATPGDPQSEQLSMQSEKAADMLKVEMALREVAREREKLWTGREVVMRRLGAEWGQDELREHLTYYMAQAKAELALRAEWLHRRRGDAKPAASGELSPREQWQSALFWFRRYEAMTLARGTGIWLSAVRRQIAECEAALDRLPAPKS